MSTRHLTVEAGRLVIKRHQAETEACAAKELFEATCRRLGL